MRPMLGRSMLPMVVLLAAGCGARDALLTGDDPASAGGSGAGGSGEGGSGAGGGVTLGQLLVAGAYHTCANDFGTSELYCWGRNSEGQLGTGDTEGSYEPRRVAVELRGAILALAAGYRHTCVAARTLENDEVWCWGENGVGQVGVTTASPRVETPTLVPIPDLGQFTVTTLTAGEYHTCAGLSDGRVYCWGDNANSQIGAPTPQSYPNPPTLVGVLGSAVGSGDFHTCVANPSELSYCWGSNFNGQLGNGSTAESSAPSPILADNLTRIESKGFTTIAMQEGGALFGWGDNTNGLIAGRGFSFYPTPAPLFADRFFSDLSVGLAHACATTYDPEADTSRLFCWGDNFYGQLGDGSGEPSSDLVKVLEEQDQLGTVAAGALHTCAAGLNGGIYCWGQNDDGRCGQPPSPAPLLVPARVPGI